MQNGCSKHHPGGQLWEVWLPSWRMRSAALDGSSFRVSISVTLARHGSFWVEYSRVHHQVGCDLAVPTWQRDFSLCAILLLSSSLHRPWSLINILTPNSMWASACASHSEWGSADYRQIQAQELQRLGLLEIEFEQLCIKHLKKQRMQCQGWAYNKKYQEWTDRFLKMEHLQEKLYVYDNSKKKKIHWTGETTDWNSWREN